MISQNGHPQSLERPLGELADLCGVLPRYRDSRGRWCDSPPTSIYQALRALGADLDVDALGGILAGGGQPGRKLLENAAKSRKEETWSRLLEPTLVFWDGLPGTLTLRVPSGGSSRVDVTLTLETGEERRQRLDVASLEIVGQERFGRRSHFAHVAPGRLLAGSRGGRVPLGRHRLRVEHDGTVAEATVISAPRRCWRPEDAGEQRWGLFSPLYALRTERDWGAGDLADLELLSRWVAGAGGSAVATLPLLASYLDAPFEPAPYRPVSRLFWNEFYLAVEGVAEWESCAAARELWGSPAVQAELRGLRAAPLVDYRAVARVKKMVLERLCRCFYGEIQGDRMRAFLSFVEGHPEVAAYAAFRARQEAAGADWRSWPEKADDGARPLAPRESLIAASPSEQYHLFCQWQMHEQLGRLSAAPPGGANGMGLLLDIPVGVHPGGFDTWRWPELFAQGISVGAPPDAFFARGQDWDSPPLHPVHGRDDGHSYFASFIAGHMRHAAYLRIDHVMSLHRLFWIPEGEEPEHGVYVRYPAEELYAVLCLESHRHQTVVVGEDLGTVPAEVRSALRRHGILGTWVFQLGLRPRRARLVPKVPRNVVAALNTHDMFPFAGFVRGDDITARLDTGQVDAKVARRERAARHRLVARLQCWPDTEGSLPAGAHTSAGEPDAGAVATVAGRPAASALVFCALAYLLRSRPALVLVNVEDLLGETKAQNQPGTGPAQGNWRRKLAGTGGGVRRATEEIGRWLRG